MDKKKFYPHKLHLVSKQVYDKRKKDLEFYHYTSIEFIALIHKLRQEIEKLENENVLLKKEKEPAVVLKYHDLSPYNQDWPFSSKICFILRSKNKPSDSLEIYMTLMEKDEKFCKMQRPQTTLAKIMNGMCKSQRLVKIKRPGIQKLLFLLPVWMDKYGEPLPFYQQFINEVI
jgi:hypothetical protein